VPHGYSDSNYQGDLDEKNQPLIMSSPWELCLPLGKVNFKLKLLNLMLKQNIVP
jgi:hypothetical protein